MFELTTGKLVLIALIAILLFGSKRIPELAKSLGESVKHLKDGINGETTNDKNKKK